MKITFFEVENWEKKYLKKQLSGHDLRLYSETLEAGYLEKIKDTEVLSPFISFQPG